MSAPGLLPAFRVWAKERADLPLPILLVVDPGGTTGLAIVERGMFTFTGSVPLSGLPHYLADCGLGDYVSAVVCEDFSLNPRRRNDPKMPASQGIGMCRLACEWAGVPLFLLQPNMKTEGRAKLDEAGQAARAACRNEHQRDVVDLAGKALYELRKAQ